MSTNDLASAAQLEAAGYTQLAAELRARHRRPTVPTPADHAECARCRAPAIVGERITVCERGHVEPMAVRP